MPLKEKEIDWEKVDISEPAKSVKAAVNRVPYDHVVSAPSGTGRTTIPTDYALDPPHYADDSQRGNEANIECIDAIRASMPPEEFAGFCKGNVIKYLWRFEKKGGTEDLDKAKVYLTWLINTMKGEDLTKI